MKQRNIAPRDGRPAGAKVKSKLDNPKRSRVASPAQGGIVSFFDGNGISARIVFAGCQALLFVAGSDGLRQVGGVLDVRGAE